MKRVLVVEDDPAFLEVVTFTLTKAGYDVRPCMEGGQVLSAVTDFKPDLVILDVMLPGIDGYTLRHQLAMRPDTRDLPIIILTGIGSSRGLFKDVATAFLTKPVRADVLLKAVSKAIR